MSTYVQSQSVMSTHQALQNRNNYYCMVIISKKGTELFLWLYGSMFQYDMSLNNRQNIVAKLSHKGCYRSFCRPLDWSKNIHCVGTGHLFARWLPHMCDLSLRKCSFACLSRPQIGAMLTSAASDLDGFKASAVFKEIAKKLEEVPRVNHIVICSS